MTAAKAYIGGTWTSLTKSGKAYIGGAWVAFGPAGGSEYLTWSAGEPTSTDLNDGTQCYNMGLVFSLVATKNCTGVRWRVPDTVATPNGTHAVAIWADVADTRVAYKEFTPVTGGYQNVLFDSPVSLTSGTNYVAAVYTNHYVLRSGSPSGFTSPSGNIVAGTGRLASYNSGAATAPRPPDPFSSTYYVSPICAT